jgi:hypothetical protein
MVDIERHQNPRWRIRKKKEHRKFGNWWQVRCEVPSCTCHVRDYFRARGAAPFRTGIAAYVCLSAFILFAKNLFLRVRVGHVLSEVETKISATSYFEVLPLRSRQTLLTTRARHQKSRCASANSENRILHARGLLSRA